MLSSKNTNYSIFFAFLNKIKWVNVMLLEGIRTYINDKELKLTILKNKIDIVNYTDIGHFDSNKIVVKTNFKTIIVTGNDLVVSKLMKDEMLITGDFNNIELR